MTKTGSVQRSAHSQEAVAFVPECIMANNRQKADTGTDEWMRGERKENPEGRRDSLGVGWLPRAKMQSQECRQ